MAAKTSTQQVEKKVTSVHPAVITTGSSPIVDDTSEEFTISLVVFIVLMVLLYGLFGVYILVLVISHKREEARKLEVPARYRHLITRNRVNAQGLPLTMAEKRAVAEDVLQGFKPNTAREHVMFITLMRVMHPPQKTGTSLPCGIQPFPPPTPSGLFRNFFDYES